MSMKIADMCCDGRNELTIFDHNNSLYISRSNQLVNQLKIPSFILDTVHHLHELVLADVDNGGSYVELSVGDELF